jgi:alanine dehydrogenase
MKVGVARESAAGERRVALVPEALGKLTAAGLEVLVEHKAGAGAAIPDSAARNPPASAPPSAAAPPLSRAVRRGASAG